MKRFSIVLPTLLITGATIAACGGSDAPSTEEYIADADAICRQADADLETVVKEQFGTTPPNRQELAQFTEDEVIPNIEDQLAELRELEPPEGDEDQVARIFDTLDQAIQEFKRNPDIENPPRGIAEANRLAEDYGFEVCGNEN
jgi:hypothetical protein